MNPFFSKRFFLSLIISVINHSSITVLMFCISCHLMQCFISLMNLRHFLFALHLVWSYASFAFVWVCVTQGPSIFFLENCMFFFLLQPVSDLCRLVPSFQNIPYRVALVVMLLHLAWCLAFTVSLVVVLFLPHLVSWLRYFPTDFLLLFPLSSLALRKF